MQQGIQTESRVERHLLRRIITYVVGQFFIAVGINLLVYADLGNSAASSVAVVYSTRFGIPLGVCTIIVYSCLVVIQILLLRRDFQLINFGQIPFAIVAGVLVDIVGATMPAIVPGNLLEQWLLLLVAMIAVALGVLFFVGTELVPMPVEGLNLAISTKTPLQFYQSKVLVDCACALVALVSSFAFFGEMVGVGLGTIVLAIGIGWMVKKIKPLLPRWLQGWHLK